MRVENHPILGESRQPDTYIYFDGKPDSCRERRAWWRPLCSRRVCAPSGTQPRKPAPQSVLRHRTLQ